jgi:ribosomal-protein-alanine N-acetyltransferase
MSHIRALSHDDVPDLTRLVVQNRAFLEPWEPARDEDYYTERAQAAIVDALLAAPDGQAFVILDHDGAMAGRITLSGIVRGPFLSGNVGYWVSADRNGKGLATAAVSELVAHAFGELGLHRLQAGTLLHNTGSQTVLQRCGFTRFGMAERYLRIDGRWQDHVLFQVLAD